MAEEADPREVPVLARNDRNEWIHVVSTRRHKDRIASIKRRLDRMIDSTNHELKDFDDTTLSKQFHIIKRRKEWTTELRNTFYDGLVESNIIVVDCEHQNQDDPEQTKPTIVLVGTLGCLVAFWTSWRTDTAAEDLPIELLRWIQSPDFFKTGPGIRKDLRDASIQAVEPIIDTVAFWDAKQSEGLLPARGVPSSLGWLNHLIHPPRPGRMYVDHKTRTRAKFWTRYKNEFIAEGINDSRKMRWNKWRNYSVMFDWEKHELKDAEPRAYAAYDLQVPINIWGKAARNWIEKDDARFFGCGMSEVLAATVENLIHSDDPDFHLVEPANLSIGGSVHDAPDAEDSDHDEEEETQRTVVVENDEGEIEDSESDTRAVKAAPKKSLNDRWRATEAAESSRKRMRSPTRSSSRPRHSDIGESSTAEASTSSGTPAAKKKRREDHLPDALKQFHGMPVFSACFRCGIKGHSRFRGICSDQVINCLYCHGVSHDTKVCRELHSLCDLCGYRGHFRGQHKDEEGNKVKRNIEADWRRFRKFADSGYYTRRREDYPSYGFWCFPEELRGKIDGLSYYLLYKHGYADAQKRIEAMRTGKTCPSKYMHPAQAKEYLRKKAEAKKAPAKRGGKTPRR